MILTLLGPASAVRAEPTTEPTRENIQTLYDAGDHKAALLLINKALATRGKHREKLDLDEFLVLMLKGECELRTNNRAGAKSAFDSAAKQAAHPDEKRAVASMIALLARAKDPKGFKPKSDPTKTIDIVADDSRKEAFEAARAELEAEFTPKLDRAQKAKNNTSKLIDLLPDLGVLAALEYGATGATEKTTAVLDPIQEQIGSSLKADIDRVAGIVEELFKLANEATIQVSTGVGGGIEDTNMRGLRGGERKTAQAAGKEVTRIGKLVTQANKTAEEWALPAGGYGEQLIACESLIKQVESALKIVPGQDIKNVE